MKQSKKNKQPTNVDIAAADERASAADTDAAEKKTKCFRRPLVRKLGYLFISLLIATTLWGYVLMSENPDRMKHVSDVPLKFEGGSEADLRSRGFVVLGESQNLLPDVTVTVKTKLNDLPSFGNSAGGEDRVRFSQPSGHKRTRRIRMRCHSFHHHRHGLFG